MDPKDPKLQELVDLDVRTQGYLKRREELAVEVVVGSPRTCGLCGRPHANDEQLLDLYRFGAIDDKTLCYDPGDASCQDLVRAALRRVQGERDEALDRIAYEKQQHDETRGYRQLAEQDRNVAVARTKALAKELQQALDELAAARANVRIATASRDDVWFWQGDGHDDPESLSCPVVMSAATLRDLLARK